MLFFVVVLTGVGQILMDTGSLFNIMIAMEETEFHRLMCRCQVQSNCRSNFYLNII